MAKRTGAKPKARAKATPKAKARKRKPAPRRPTIPAAEVERRLEVARAAALGRRANRSKLQEQLASALEVAQAAAPYPSVLKVAFPPRTHVELPGKKSKAGIHGEQTGKFQWKVPWVLVGRFVWRGKEPIGYAELWRILDAWSKTKVTKRINPERVARIRVIYITDDGKREEYTLAETGPWEWSIAKAKRECDPDDTETAKPGGARGSLASRYGIMRGKNDEIIGGTQIESVFVWLADQIGFQRMKLR